MGGLGDGVKAGDGADLPGPQTLSEKTIAANVQRWGTGAINIDSCRIGSAGGAVTHHGENASKTLHAFGDGLGARGGKTETPEGLGRFPANLIHDGSAEAVAGFSGDGGFSAETCGHPHTLAKGQSNRLSAGMTSSASRFFYSPKAGPLDRIGTSHATVKPVDLMRWLCRLVTPPGGTVLDPFAGSGTTGIAAMAEGFDCDLVEMEADHVADINRKLAFLRGEGGASVIEKHKAKIDRADKAGRDPLPLFGGAS